MARAVAAVSGVLAVIFPPAAAGLLLLAGAARGQRRLHRAWPIIWAGYLLPLAAVGLLTGHDWLTPTLQALFGVALGLVVAVDRPRALTIGITVGLVVATGAGLLERELSRRLWWDASTPPGVTQLLSGVSELSGDSAGWTRNGVRLFAKSWDTRATGVAPHTLSFELRGTSPYHGWQWYTNDPTTDQQLLFEGDEPFTRLSQPAAPVVKRVRTDAPLAGRTVRATLELRSGAAALGASESALVLRTFEPASSTLQPLALTDDWQTFRTTFTFPAAASQTAFEVALATPALQHIDVRRLRVEEAVAGNWVPLGPAEPAGVNLRVPLPATHVFAQPTLTLRPTLEWTGHSLQVPVDLAGEPPDSLTALLQVEAGTVIELRDVRLTGLTGAGMDDAVADPKARSRLLYEQANLAGHSYVASGLLALMLTATGTAGSLASSAGRRRRLAAGVLVSLAMLAAVATTGSRTAFFGGTLAAMALLVNSQLPPPMRFQRWLLYLAATVMVVVALFGLGVGGDALGRLAFWQNGGGANQVSRVEITQAAIAGVRAAPLTGWGADGFPELWRTLHPGDARAVPQHAHSFWLQLAVAYGVPGLMAALWLSGGLALLAVRAKRPEPLVVVGTLLAMQLLDHTLTHVGVLLPLVAVLAAWPGSRVGPSSRSWG